MQCKLFVFAYKYNFLFSLFTLAKLSIVFATFAVYMVQFYVPLDFMEPVISKKLKLDSLTYRFPNSHHLIQNFIFCTGRTVLVIMTGAIHYPLLLLT